MEHDEQINNIIVHIINWIWHFIFIIVLFYKKLSGKEKEEQRKNEYQRRMDEAEMRKQ